MITLTFLENKKLICCNALNYAPITKLSVRWAANEDIAFQCGNLFMNLSAMSNLVTAKNKDAGQFAAGFMDAYDDFIADFMSDLAGCLDYTNGDTVETTLASLNSRAHAFTNDYVTPL